MRRARVPGPATASREDVGGPAAASLMTAESLENPRSPLLRMVALPAWDGLLRASGAVAGLGIVLTVVKSPASELAVLFSLALLANGPFSMFLPAAVEPMVMIFARLYPALLVAAVATSSAVLAEYVDYRVFAGILFSGPLERARNTRTARFIVWMFRQSPFLAVFVGALTPLPFWLVRICAVLDSYPLRRFLVATAVGRYPRFVLYALLGTWLPIRNDVLAAGALALTVVFAVVIWVRARRRPGEQPSQA